MVLVTGAGCDTGRESEKSQSHNLPCLSYSTDYVGSNISSCIAYLSSPSNGEV